MRLIDADKLPKYTGYALSADEVAMAVENAPTIDAVEVVRCKDCKHLFDGEHNENCCAVLMEKAKWLTEITVDENWYCPEGERRTDELGITN